MYSADHWVWDYPVFFSATPPSTNSPPHVDSSSMPRAAGFWIRPIRVTMLLWSDSTCILSPRRPTSQLVFWISLTSILYDTLALRLSSSIFIFMPFFSISRPITMLFSCKVLSACSIALSFSIAHSTLPIWSHSMYSLELSTIFSSRLFSFSSGFSIPIKSIVSIRFLGFSSHSSR